MKKPYYVRVETHPENPDIIRMSAVPAESYADDINRIGSARSIKFLAFKAPLNCSTEAYTALFRVALGDLLTKVEREEPKAWRWIPGAYLRSADAIIPAPILSYAD